MDLPAGRFARVSPRMCEIAGYPEEELSGLTLAGITPPEERAGVSENLRRLAEGEARGHEAEGRLARKDGSVVRVSIDTRVIPGEAGRPEERKK